MACMLASDAASCTCFNAGPLSPSSTNNACTRPVRSASRTGWTPYTSLGTLCQLLDEGAHHRVRIGRVANGPPHHHRVGAAAARLARGGHALLIALLCT